MIKTQQLSSQLRCELHPDRMFAVRRCFLSSAVYSFTKKACFAQVMRIDYQSVTLQRITTFISHSGENRVVTLRSLVTFTMAQKSGSTWLTKHPRFYSNVGESKVARVKRVSIEGNIGKYLWVIPEPENILRPTNLMNE